MCFFYSEVIAERGSPKELFGDPQNDRTDQFLNAVLETN
jgi:polar amino acid transport system ATP-binding protein